MKTQIMKSDAPKIRVGSIVTFTNNVDFYVKLVVSRVENKSWYVGTSRKSYGTLVDYKNSFPDFNIKY